MRLASLLAAGALLLGCVLAPESSIKTAGPGGSAAAGPHSAVAATGPSSAATAAGAATEAASSAAAASPIAAAPAPTIATSTASLVRAAGEIPPQLKLLADAYPGAFQTRFDDTYGWGVQFDHGTFIPWDEGKQHTDFESLLADPNLKDIFAIPYIPVGPDSSANSDTPAPPPVNHDPGRIRHQGFFQALYGSTREEVESRLQPVPWLAGITPDEETQVLLVTTTHGVAERLQRISDRLERLPQEYHRYVSPAAGAYFWRKIAGTDRLSMHSLGIAMDINPAHGHYWQWDARPDNKNNLPTRIVRIFEEEGFIWGGHWYHYDTFHFEYRPELLSTTR